MRIFARMNVDSVRMRVDFVRMRIRFAHMNVRFMHVRMPLGHMPIGSTPKTWPWTGIVDASLFWYASQRANGCYFSFRGSGNERDTPADHTDGQPRQNM